ncbi:MAG: DNA primase, partial [Muribaculaceae bacterium]|nr:DNA primase [Muribaculaceae bacterium]
MKKIDPLTVQRILDTADIVEVVSDFVSLKRRGSGYIGLCPFHNERTPSFSVSKAKGICKCFSCGKGGSPVGFIMEHEQMSYAEALRYLARKYGIEIKEQEMTEEETRAESERESLMAVNDFAMHHFEHNLTETQSGRDIGLAYFRERGINDSAIQKFHLGYALEQSETLYREAINKGYNEEHLITTGLCIKTDSGRIYDRFKGRVIYPVFSLSGKVLAFGGRTLRKDKDVAKYVNSPESSIYKKSNVLYGLYQARKSIVDHDKCILVEGYMDVISMHQRGVENVVASSGTSLTDGQIRLIHRFTTNVTVIYDSDPAGIKASLRGIDMLLAEGLNIKVLSLPDGDDPDSFAQSHSTSEIEAYIAEHEEDFIRFKTRILTEKLPQNDPVSRSRVIKEIVRSISVIPEELIRTEYRKECSRMLGTDENVLLRQEVVFRNEQAEKDASARQRRQQADTIPPENEPIVQSSRDTSTTPATTLRASVDDTVRFLRPYECAVLRYVLKYGMLHLCDSWNDDGSTKPMSVMEYVDTQLAADSMQFSNPDYINAYNQARALANETWQTILDQKIALFDLKKASDYEHGMESIRANAADADTATKMEKQLSEQINSDYAAAIDKFSAEYIE